MRVFMTIVCAIKLIIATIRSIGGKAHAAPMTQEELDQALAAAAAGVPDAVDWRNSIVDLLKILQLDSSYAARAELWSDFGPKNGPYGGSAAQNIELHKIVMTKVMEHEIKV